MGYSTSYTLECEPRLTRKISCAHCGTPMEDGESSELSEAVLAEALPSYKGDTFAGVLEEACKWYDHENDMKALSRKYPEVLFTLRGEGEDAGDVWVKYFKGGKMQAEKQPEFVPPPFDAGKLA